MKEEMQTMVVKMSSQHKVAVQSIALAEKEPVAVVVRRLIRQEARRRGLWGQPPGQVDQGTTTQAA